MAGTYAFDIKTALVAMLKADAGMLAVMENNPDAITYGYGNFGAGERPRLTVWVGEIEWDDEQAIALGGARRDELFRIMITIESAVEGDTQEEANDRVEAIMKVIEALVRNPRWSGLGDVRSELKPQMLGEAPGNTGRMAMLILSLQVKARKS